MKVTHIDILSENQVKGDKKLSCLSQSISCRASDLARLMGVDYNVGNGYGSYWLNPNKNPNNKNKNRLSFISAEGQINSLFSAQKKVGVRITIPFSSITDFDITAINDLNLEYPLTHIGGMAKQTIDKLFKEQSGILTKTGRCHDIDGTLYEEYSIFDIKFIKMNCEVAGKTLTDGTISEKDKTVYLKVEEIPFIVDEASQMLISDIILFANPYDNKTSNYEESELSKYLNNAFLKSINDELEHSVAGPAFEGSLSEKKNRYHFTFAPLSEEEIIEICIKSNISVFVHGKTGVGKTERMLALDPDLELVDFGCTSSDGFTGIVAKDYNSKELILYEPYWYKSLVAKCTKGLDKIHILFLEELTNAKSDLQKVAFEVTLNKTLTNSGFRLDLPKNAVVVAAGNEASESRSANSLSEPLFGRFAHVYIKTNSEDWLAWALNRKKSGKTLVYREENIPNTIHPAIVDYIKLNGERVLRTAYNGQTPNADPRKWALASKALYQCNNPQVLRAFVGEEITKDFIEFCHQEIITLEDVLNNRATIADIPTNAALRWYIISCLSNVDEENVLKVRDFVAALGSEYLAVFDYEWSKNNEQRIMFLYNLEQEDKARVRITHHD